MITEAEAVLSRLAEALGARTDADLARALEVRPSVVANWRMRRSVPPGQIIRAASLSGRSTEWITTGREAHGARVEEPTTTWRVAATTTEPAPAQSPRCPLDRRLEAVQAWLTDWWDAATDEERAWLLVELRMLRRRMPRGDG